MVSCFRIFVTYKNVRAISGPNNALKLLKPTGHVMHQQFNIQQLYALPHTVFMCSVFI